MLSILIKQALAAGIEVSGAAGTASASFTPLTTIITGIYDLALTVGGILAFGAIIYGAARYTLAAGNPSGQHEGKESITQALLGLLLLFSAYLILHTINPDLTTIKLPELAKVEVKKTQNIKSCSGSEYGYCPNGTCIRISPGVASYKCVSNTVTVEGYGCKKTGSSDIVCSPANSTACSDISSQCGTPCGVLVQCTRIPAPAGSPQPCGDKICGKGQTCITKDNGSRYCE